MIGAGTNVAIFVPIWLRGWAAYQVRVVEPRFGRAIFCLSIGAIALFCVWAMSYGFLREETSLPRHDLKFIAQDFVLALLVAVNLVGIAAIGNSGARPKVMLGSLIHWLSGTTFTLYLLHVPLILFVRAVAPFDHRTLAFDTLLLGFPLAVVFLVAEFTERRKSVWKALFTYVFVSGPRLSALAWGSDGFLNRTSAQRGHSHSRPARLGRRR